MSISKDLTHTTFLRREYEQKHTSYNEELSYYQPIKDGDITNCELLVKAFVSDGVGHLSDNPLRNRQYLFVAAITMITRFAIEGGLEGEDAYNLSDIYIQKMDQCRTPDEIITLFRQMVQEFAKKVREVYKNTAYSKPVMQALDYIYDHLHWEITVAEISEHVGLSQSYFSVLFKKETGRSIAEYVRGQRIEAAKNMLRYSDHSYLDISNYLAFSSHSHFISVFKKEVGMTPKEYRNKYYEKNWE